jgi:hypothetical protein
MAADTRTPDVAIAEEAFVLAYPLVMTRRTMVQATAVAAPEPDTMRAPVNTVVQCRDTPDTLRISGWLDLADGPVVLSVPATHGRFYALWLRDAWTDVFASVGARTTGTAARTFAVLGPQDDGGHLPAGLTPIAAPTRFVHLEGCLEAVRESGAWARDGFAVAPLSARRGQQAAATALSADARDPVEQVERMGTRAFFSEVSRLIADNPPDSAGRAALGRLHELAARETPTAGVQDALTRGVSAGRASVRAGTRRVRVETGGGWRVRSDLGRVDDALHRAQIARSRQPADPAVDVLHAEVDGDADDRPLDGRCRYLLRFAPECSPPVHAFWSLETLPGHASSVGDRRGLALDPDGSLPVYIQRRPPVHERKPNWLPAPRDAFSVALHLYWPRDEALQRRWSPPALTRVG